VIASAPFPGITDPRRAFDNAYGVSGYGESSYCGNGYIDSDYGNSGLSDESGLFED
jgi:hypothetical protein